MTSTDETLRELIVECLERMETRGSSALEDLCSDNPEHASALRRRIALLQDVGLMSATEGKVEIGTRLGDFELKKRIGEGGMGVVYLAHEGSLDREVALKLIRPDRLYFDQARARFQREVELAAGLQHPGIVPVFSVGEENGLPYFAMERVRGATLGAVIDELGERKPQELAGEDIGAALAACMTQDDDADGASIGSAFRGSYVECSVELVRQAARALEHAHGRGVLHRDVKPSNLMLTPEGRVLLLDFGLASTAGVSNLTGSRDVLGSLQYMAPEQHRGEDTDERTDVFGLGVTLYELLTLRRPFEGRNAASLAASVLLGSTTKPREHNAGIPLDVETVCLTAMERDPARRYATIGDFARDLEHLLAHEPIEARRLGAGLRLQRWSQRHPALTLSFFVGLFLSAIALGSLALVTRDSNQKLEQANSGLETALDKALAAIDRMLASVGNELSDVPQAQTLRVQVMDDALALFEEVAALGPISNYRRQQWADLYTHRADALRVIGDHEAAEESYAQGIAMLEELARDVEDTELLHSIAVTRARAGMVLEEDGREADAILEYEGAEKAYDALLELVPDHAEARTNREQMRYAMLSLRANLGDIEPAVALARRLLVDLEARTEASGNAPEEVLRTASIRYKLADNLYLLAEHDESFATYDQALAEFGSILEHRHTLHEIPFRFAECADNYGLALALLDRFDEAVPILEEGIDVAYWLVETFPDNDEYRHRFARLNNSLAETRMFMKRPDLALENLEVALSENMRLVERTPSSVRRRSRASESMMLLGASLTWLGELDDGREMLERAIESQRKVVEASPNHREHDRVMGTAHVELGILLLEQGEAEAAAGSFAELIRYCEDDPWTIGEMVKLMRRRGLVPDDFEGGDDRDGYEALVEHLTRTAGN